MYTSADAHVGMLTAIQRQLYDSPAEAALLAMDLE